MKKQLPIEEKVDLIKRVLAGEQITRVAKDAGISRTVLYRWLSLYGTAETAANASERLANKTRSGKSHWKKITKPMSRKILKLALADNNATIREIAAKTGFSTGFVWKTLKESRLHDTASRIRHRNLCGASLYNMMSGHDKFMLLRRYEQGERVGNLCRELLTSRTSFYKWLKEYKNAGEKESVFESIRPSADKHWRFIAGLDEKVLSLVGESPELSLDKIHERVTKDHRIQVSRTGLYYVLKRLKLTTYKERVTYAASHGIISNQVQQLTEVQIPAKPDYSFNSFLSPPSPKHTSSSPNFLLLISSSSLLFVSFVVLIVYLISHASGISEKIGMLFSIVSLLCGMFFFLYSVKYYFTIAIVLSFSRKDEDNGKGSFFSRLFGFEISIEDDSGIGNLKNGNSHPKELVNGLQADLSNVILERQPFISVHVSTYNEKRVIDRLLTALTSFDYPNYEVIVADDSTDETVELIEAWRSHPRIKISHRESRDGYKGQALQQALALTDKRAEFIAVFDADFIPYADSLTQFLKYFQLTNGSLDFGQGESELNNSNIAAVQGYQWHVLNKSENWITRGVRSEYAGSYVIERSGTEIYQGLKQISGSVYMIRRDVLESIGWGRSITEDFQLSLKLYEAGYKVVYTPYIQAPAEAASTIKRLIRQRMRWSEGHSFNVKKMFARLLLGRYEATVVSGEESSNDVNGKNLDPQFLIHDSVGELVWKASPLTLTEKLEFLYLTPYYLQAAFFMIGTFSWFLAEVVFQVRLPFWTEVWGWSLVATNLFALPLMNMVGLFMEESDERDYMGLFSFIALSYIVAPFQAYAAVKGFLEKEEGPWFRTPKTGKITDTFSSKGVFRLVRGMFGRPAPQFQISPLRHGFAGQVAGQANQSPYLALATANNRFDTYTFIPSKKRARWLGKVVLSIFLAFTLTLYNIPGAGLIKPASASITGTGTGADGAVTISASHNCQTSHLITGRTQPDCYMTYVSVTSNSGQKVLTVNATAGFLANDEVLIVTVLSATLQGQYEFATVSSVAAGSLTMVNNLGHTYAFSSGTEESMVIRVPQFTNLTINSGGIFTVSAYSSASHVGGILPFRATGTVAVNTGGKIDLGGLGFVGGAAKTGATGGATNTTGSAGGSGNNGVGPGKGNGGGVGGNPGVGGSTAGGAGGAGGGGGGGNYAGSTNTAGGAGTAATGGQGANAGSAGGVGSAGTGGSTGGTYGIASLSTSIFFGSGAGSGAGGASGAGGTGLGGAGGTGGQGGTGGGMLYMAADTITVTSTGAVSVDGSGGNAGNNGANGTTCGSFQTGGGGGAPGSPGGGGAGGSVYMRGSSVTLGSSLVSASGGAAGSSSGVVGGNGGGGTGCGTAGTGSSGAGGGGAGGNTGTGGNGGAGAGVGTGGVGGVGRIHVEYVTISGTTSPTYDPLLLPENVLLFAPLALFIPRLVAMLRLWWLNRGNLAREFVMRDDDWYLALKRSRRRRKKHPVRNHYEL